MYRLKYSEISSEWAKTTTKRKQPAVMLIHPSLDGLKLSDNLDTLKCLQ